LRKIAGELGRRLGLKAAGIPQIGRPLTNDVQELGYIGKSSTKQKPHLRAKFLVNQ
jgi:hypothetical protein